MKPQPNAPGPAWTATQVVLKLTSDGDGGLMYLARVEAWDEEFGCYRTVRYASYCSESADQAFKDALYRAREFGMLPWEDWE